MQHPEQLDIGNVYTRQHHL